MLRPVKGCQTPRLQQEDKIEPERDHPQMEQPDATEGKVTADYDLDVDYKRSEPEVEPHAQEQREDRSRCRICKNGNAQRWDLLSEYDAQETYMGILWVQKALRPEIMASGHVHLARI